MKHRPGVTLVEVLVAIFIMGIGMLAVLTLFPLGALNMARALQDDRAATAAQIATSMAVAFDLRHDGNVVPAFTPPPNYQGTKSFPVFVDPYGMLAGAPNTLGLPSPQPQVRRVNPASRLGSASSPGFPSGAARFCSLLDDIGFLQDGTSDLSTGFVNRGGTFTWAY